jgi:hypothetical protein
MQIKNKKAAQRAASGWINGETIQVYNNRAMIRA